MDYYHILRVSPGASKKEIEQAHDQLIKDSRYDPSIDLRMVESAYRILSDPTYKAAYDSSVSAKLHGAKPVRKKQWNAPTLTTKELLRILAVLSIVAAIFYGYRYGHLMKSFDVGDVLYMTETKVKLGRIIQKENNHDFQTFRADAYLVEKDNGETVWFPKKNVRIHCYKKKNP